MGMSLLVTRTNNHHLLKPLSELEEDVLLEAIPVSPGSSPPCCSTHTFLFFQSGFLGCL